VSRFIITLESTGAAEQNAVTEMIQQKGWPCWHHVEGIWLIGTAPDEVTPHKICDELEAIPIIGTKRKLVIKIPDDTPITHYGRANGEGWPWMLKYWGKVG
jgi:hypothetical protein